MTVFFLAFLLQTVVMQHSCVCITAFCDLTVSCLQHCVLCVPLTFFRHHIGQQPLETAAVQLNDWFFKILLQNVLKTFAKHKLF